MLCSGVFVGTLLGGLESAADGVEGKELDSLRPRVDGVADQVLDRLLSGVEDSVDIGSDGVGIEIEFERSSVCAKSDRDDIVRFL